MLCFDSGSHYSHCSCLRNSFQTKFFFPSSFLLLKFIIIWLTVFFFFCFKGTIFTSLKSLNEKSRARFLQFVRSLGKEVDLARWEGYHGNLDVKFPFRHGRKAIAASLHQRHIMFPVLPWFLSHTAAEDLLCRCTTVLIYLESGHLDVPITVKDNFIHNYLVISPDKETEGFRVMDVFRCSIGRYRPTIPRDYLFLPGERFTQFLLYKMINADRAASHCRELDCLDILRRKNRQKLINAVVEGDLMDAAPQHRLNGSNPRELPASSPASSKKTKRKYRSNELKEKGGERERERKKSVGGSGDSPHVGFCCGVVFFILSFPLFLFFFVVVQR